LPNAPITHRDRGTTKRLVSFPSEAMASVTDEELAIASTESHAVIEEAKAAGVYVFGGGIDPASLSELTQGLARLAQSPGAEDHAAT
jgi:hypothetical protein